MTAIESGIGIPYWHIHHETLMEFTTEPIEQRIRYIEAQKPYNERAIRLRLMRPVIGPLPNPLNKAMVDYVKARADADKAWADAFKARADYDKAWADADKAWADADKAWADADKARADYDKEVEALHAIECPDCPWNGRTIFP